MLLIIIIFINKKIYFIWLSGTIKSEDEADASASEKEVDEHGETDTTKATTKGKRKLQTRKGSKLLQLQTKAVSDSESDTGTNIL